MAHDPHPRLTASEGRRFALTVAGGFAVLAAVAALRSRPSLSVAIAIVAGAFALGAVVAPARLGPVRAAWIALGVALSRVTAPLFYAVLYWVVLTPIGLVRRTFGHSPLARDAGARSFWIEREPLDDDTARRRMERPF